MTKQDSPTHMSLLSHPREVAQVIAAAVIEAAVAGAAADHRQAATIVSETEFRAKRSATWPT
jgi:hypothetical protein